MALTAAVCAVTLAGCDLNSQALDYRYRLTVEIDTPSGLRTGSSVIEVQPQLRGEHAASMAVNGQAVPIDLPGRRTVYALLWSEASADWAGWIVHWLVRTPQINVQKMTDQIRFVASTAEL